MYPDPPAPPSSSSSLTLVLSRVGSLFPLSLAVSAALHATAKWPLLPHLLHVLDFAGHLSSLYECPVYPQRKHLLSLSSAILVDFPGLFASCYVAATVCPSMSFVCSSTASIVLAISITSSNLKSPFSNSRLRSLFDVHFSTTCPHISNSSA